MKPIRSIFRFAALLLMIICGAQTVKAQMYIMVHKTDGDVLKIAVSEVDSVTFREWTGPIFSYEYVDLGLSVKWATCNVGAQSPEQAGGYFAWGETEEKDEYYSDNNKFIDSDGKLTKYNLWQSLGKVDMKYRLDPEDDAAAVLLGDGWRTPTREEFQELRDFCDWAPAVLNGVQGYRVTSRRNDNSIFLPLTGERWENDTIGYNRYAYYYSNTMAIDYANSSYDVYSAYMYYVDEDYYGWYENTYYRTGGLAIRPVYSSSWESGIAESAEVSIEESEVNIEVGQSVTLNGSFVLADGSEIRPEWKSSNAMIARVDYSGRLYGVSEGQCMIYASYGNNSDSCLVTVTGFEQEMEYVDLGLSVNWATCNIGASRPEYVGLYFAWGETEAKAEYDNWSTYKYSNSEGYLTKYNQYPSLGVNGFVDNLTVLEPDDDAAHVIWGDEWRMPTYEEITELVENCDFHEIKDEDGILGYYVTSRVEGHEKSSIFIPYTNELGAACFWTSSIAGRRSDYAALLVNGTNSYIIARCAGMPIRPVCPNYNYVAPTLELSSNELAVVVGKTSEISAFMNDSWIDPTNVTWISSDTTVATIDIYGIIIAKAEGTTTITATYKDQSDNCIVTVIEDSSPTYVDLGLSVKWATFNVGATAPFEIGDYYAWGAIDTTSNYSWESYRFFTGYNDDEEAQVSKYVTNSYYGENVDNLTVLESADDVASVKWGGNWRIPTRAEIEELINLCEWEWTEYDGVYGYKVTSRVTGFMDRSIFLPEYFWSSSLLESNALGAYALAGQKIGAYYRKAGLTIRPVYTFDVSEIEGLLLDKSVVSLALGSEVVVNASPVSVDGRAIAVNGALNITWTSGDADVATVTDGKIKAVGVGKCVITATYDGETYEVSVTVEDPYDVEPESVDLGLSVKWATFNVGAFSPEMTGDFFAWGEVEPYYESGYAESMNPVWKDGKSTGYTWASYKWAEYNDESGIYSVTKYGEDGKTVLEADDDAAVHAWGGDWRMPDQIEFEELLAKCTWELVVEEGYKGYKVTSNIEGYTDKSIFLPITESRSGQMLFSDGEGYYWSRNVNEKDLISAWYLYIDEEYESVWNYYRYQGRAVRPVCPSETWQGITSIELDSTTIDVALGYPSSLSCRILSGTEDYTFMGVTSWTSSDEDVVTVNEFGELKGIKEGVATITAYYNELYAECQVTVKKLSETNPELVSKAYNDMYVKLGAPGSCGYYQPDDFGFIMIAFSGDVEGSDLFLPNSSYNWFSTCSELTSRNNNYRNGMIRYNACYNVINEANRFMCSFDEDSDDPQVQAMIGEAHALRAFAYLNLAPYYQVSYTSSDEAKNLPCVPLLTLDSDPSNNPRATLQEVYDQIISDLNTAIDKLDGWQRIDKSRIDQQVAYGLRARAYLNMGMWSEAAEDAAVALRGFEPASRTDVSAPFLYDLSESNWMWGYDMNDSLANEMPYATSSSWIRSFSGYSYSAGVGVYSMINSDLYDLIPSSDVRKGWWVNENLYSPLLDSLKSWDGLWGQEIASGIVPGQKEPFLPYTNVKFGTKYPGNDANDEDWCWMRAEEMILIRAEGLAKSGNADAASRLLTGFVTSYRDPYYDIEGRGLSLEDEIWFQRRVELWGEGFSNNDLRRLNKPLVRFHDNKENNCPDYYRLNMSADNGWWLMRFPSMELERNAALEDNTGGSIPYAGENGNLLDGVTDYCANGGGYDEYYLSIYPRKLDLQIGDEYSLSYETNSDETVLWSSSDEDVATVDKYGLVAAIAEGYCTITATAGKLSAECGVVVMAEYNDTIPQGNEGEEEEEIEYIGDVQAYLPAAFADSNAVAAWYMNVTEGENSLKLESVFLFVDGTLVVTKSKFYTNKDGRQPEYGVNAYGTYELTDGDFNNGVASVVLSDGSKFEVEIEDGVMLAMGDYFSIQDNDDLPIPMGK